MTLRGTGAAMTCDEAALVLMVGDDPAAVARAERHQAICGECGVSARSEVPDHLRAALPLPPRWLLLVLIGLGVVHFVVSIPWLVGSDPFGLLGDTVPPAHAARDGAIGIVMAIAAIMAATRPRWARPGFLVAAGALAAQAIAGVVDSSIADTGPSELIHLLSLVLALLIGVCVVTQTVRPMGPVRRPRLHDVDRPD